jgi:hypothetical protein
MSSDPIKLPYAIKDHNGLLRVLVKYDDVCVDMQHPASPVDVPECPVAPLVIVQALDGGKNAQGPAYVYDYDKEDWTVFDDRIHEVPKSAPVDVGAKSRQLDMSASSKVELSAKGAPTLESPSEADDELDEPSDESLLGPELDLGEELDLDDEEDE